jgi:aminoglycoside 6'-N-acetyltransferase
MTDNIAIALRSATEADWPMIRRWLAQPDIVQWWGPKASSEAAVMMAMASAHALCRIIEVDGEAVGYVHALDATLWGEDLPDALEPGTWDIDVFVASHRHRNRGIGMRALQLIKEEVFSSTLAIAVCVFAAVANERAVRAYEKAGFKWKEVWDDPAGGRSWFMTAERPVR